MVTKSKKLQSECGPEKAGAKNNCEVWVGLELKNKNKNKKEIRGEVVLGFNIGEAMLHRVEECVCGRASWHQWWSKRARSK